MSRWERSYLRPPVFEDEEQQQLARLLHPILLFGVITNGLALLGLILLGDESARRSAGFVVLAEVANVLFFVLLYQGHVRVVGHGLALTVWVLCTGGVVLLGGIRSPSLGFLVFAIIYAFLLLGHRSGMFFLLLAVATLGLILVAERQDLLPDADPLPDSGVVIVYFLIFTVSGWVVDVVTRNLRRSLRRAQAAEQRLRYKADLQALVTRLSTEFVNLPPDDSVSTHIQRAMETVSTFVGVDACQLWLFGADPSTLTLAHTWSAPSFAQASTDALSAAPHSWLLGQLQHLETVYMPSVDALPAEAQSLRTTWQQASVQSTLQVPLVASERLVGVISFYTTHPIPTWSEDVTQLLTMVGAIFVQALQRQQAEQQRHALIAERERIGFLQEFMGNVTHDIKNPLSVIRTSLYVARKASDPDRRLTSLNTIERQADRIDALVEDLLLLTRLDSDQPLELVVVDLKPLLEDVVGQQRPLAAEKHLAYEVSLPTTLPPVLAHADDIRRVFVNLIENAIRYTLDGCSIAIRARSEAKTVFIEVTDTGIGIPASDVPRVFDRFFRAENASSMSERGTGLGLAIVQRIVEKHGGQIVVESEEGRGSTFRVALPRWDGSGPQPVPVH